MAPLSEKDQKWAREEQARREAEKANKAAAGEFQQSDPGKSLASLNKLEDGKFIDSKIGAPPKFFLLYFSASW